MVEYGRKLRTTVTPIPGLLVVDLPVHGDNRGWFKENWQQEKMTAAGLPDFGPVQNNVSFNGRTGTTRGIHAEPWDKLVSVATGRIFGAWVDLRDGETFGTTFTCELDASRAVFVPRGVGNAYQTLEPDTAYTYLVNAHWSADAAYTFLNLDDPVVKIPWPVPLKNAEISAKDATHPYLDEVVPVAPRKTLVLGADGQLGRALRAHWGTDPRIEYAARDDLDLTAGAVGTARRWQDYQTIVNAAAYTAVDDAETVDGRREAWAVNVAAVNELAHVAARHGITLVHVSSDYVFDGRTSRPYREDDPVSPLGVYGQTKAAGDAVVRTVPQHYIVRTSWVIGDGANFVRTMRKLAEREIAPRVVADQIGRLTFTDQLAEAIAHLLDAGAPFGTYNVTSSGEPRSWADIAREVFRLTGHDPTRITDVTTAEYTDGSRTAAAPRPSRSVLDLEKIAATGFTPADGASALADYLRTTTELDGDR